MELSYIFEEYGLTLVFLSLVTTPFGNPIPEDVSLFFAGALAKTFPQHFDIIDSVVVGYTGVILGDCIAWAMGQRVGLHPKGFLSRLIGKKALLRMERFYKRWGAWAIVICRQFPGFRLPCFFFAGASGMSFGKFIAVDGSAACITTGIFVYLGYKLGDYQIVAPFLSRFRHIAFVVLAIAAGFIIYRVVVYQMEARKDAEAAAQDQDEDQNQDRTW